MNRTNSYAVAFSLLTLAGVCLHVLLTSFHGWNLCPIWWKAFMSVSVWLPAILAIGVMADCWKRNGMYKGEFYIIVLAVIFGISYFIG